MSVAKVSKEGTVKRSSQMNSTEEYCSACIHHIYGYIYGQNAGNPDFPPPKKIFA